MLIGPYGIESYAGKLSCCWDSCQGNYLIFLEFQFNVVLAYRVKSQSNCEQILFHCDESLITT